MNKLQTLIAECKCGVDVSINEHRNVYQTAAEYLEDAATQGFDVQEDVREKMIATDTIVDVHFYPNTPVGFYKVLHYDLDAALEEALSILLPNACSTTTCRHSNADE